MSPLPCVLYRQWDADSRLLYVGISASFMARLVAHQHGSPWFDEVVRISLQRFATREEAHAAERRAIREENPIHNKERYPEPIVLTPHPPGGLPDRAPGTYLLSQRAEDRIVERVCRPPFSYKTMDGIAATLEMDVDYLTRFVAVPAGKKVRPGYNDLFGLADRICRGTLASEAPWVLGSPLREPDPEPRRYRRSAQSARAAA